MKSEEYKSIKKTVKEFVSANLLRIIVYFALLFILTAKSTVALVVYSVSIHALVIVFILLLCSDKVVTRRLIPYKRLLFMFIEGIIFTFIMICTGYLYTSFATTVYVVLIFVEILDHVEHTQKLAGR